MEELNMNDTDFNSTQAEKYARCIQHDSINILRS